MDKSDEKNGREVGVEELTLASFAPFGTFADMSRPTGNVFGQPPVRFFPDMLRLDTGGKSPTFSVCLVESRPPIVTISEYHTSTGEGIFAWDAPIDIHVAEPTGGAVVPWKRIRIFHVPKGTLVVLHPGVWHHTPFLASPATISASVLIILPERTYRNDCVPIDLPPSEQVKLC